MKFPLTEEDVQLKLLLEAISRQQKEKGQREMEKINIQPFVRLDSYLNNKWKNAKYTKENLLKKREEKRRFLEILSYAHQMERYSDKSTQNYIKNLTGNYSLWLTGPGSPESKGEESSFNQMNDGSTFLGIGRPNLKDVKEYGGDISFKTDNKNVRTVLRKYIILHEYGHLYEFIKQYVETGEAEVPDTMSQRPDDTANNEGKANAYAMDNIYRKDRRLLLKNSDISKEKLEQSENKIKGSHYKSDEYLAGTNRHSKTIKKTLDSIEKENSHFNY